MLRDYLSTENWRLLDAALEQFIELPASLKLVQCITISPDSFLWKITDGEKMYYLYAEDYVQNLESVRSEITPFMPSDAVLYFVPVKQPIAFEDSSPNKVRVSRDLLQLAETAALNDDYFSLSAVQGIIMTLLFADLEDETLDMSLMEKYVNMLENELTGDVKKNASKKKQLQAQIYARLAKTTQSEINATKYMAENITATVTLVTAMYVARKGDETSGITIGFAVDGDTIMYPVEHFMNDKLREYFSQKPHINEMNITNHMPEQLGEYKRIESSVSVKRIFRKELDHLSW